MHKRSPGRIVAAIATVQPRSLSPRLARSCMLPSVQHEPSTPVPAEAASAGYLRCSPPTAPTEIQQQQDLRREAAALPILRH